MNLAEQLKSLRLSAGLTQTELAKKLNISQQSYARQENGKVTPSLEKLNDIAHFFEVSIDYLSGKQDTVEQGDGLDNIELLFRMNSKGLIDEEKEIFKNKKELIEFMEDRKKAFRKRK